VSQEVPKLEQTANETRAQRLQSFEADLCAALGAVEAVLRRRCRRPWEVLLITWNPQDLDQIYTLAPASIPRDQLAVVAQHALRQPETGRVTPRPRRVGKRPARKPQETSRANSSTPCLHPAPLPHTVTPSAAAQHCYGVCRSCGVSRAWPSTEECRDA
jgi:hypothetical protein